MRLAYPASPLRLHVQSRGASLRDAIYPRRGMGARMLQVGCRPRRVHLLAYQQALTASRQARTIAQGRSVEEIRNIIIIVPLTSS